MFVLPSTLRQKETIISETETTSTTRNQRWKLSFGKNSDDSYNCLWKFPGCSTTFWTGNCLINTAWNICLVYYQGNIVLYLLVASRSHKLRCPNYNTSSDWLIPICLVLKQLNAVFETAVIVWNLRIWILHAGVNRVRHSKSKENPWVCLSVIMMQHGDTSIKWLGNGA